MCISSPRPAPAPVAAPIVHPPAPEPTPSAPAVGPKDAPRPGTDLSAVTAKKKGTSSLRIDLNVPGVSKPGNGLQIPA